jgi:hypothetical protein
MTCMPLSPVIAHFYRISLIFSMPNILLVPEFCYSRIIVIRHIIMIKAWRGLDAGGDSRGGPIQGGGGAQQG